jgi:formate dehydrogenase iron-sulfur subunit
VQVAGRGEAHGSGGAGDAQPAAAGSTALPEDGSRWLMASNVCKHCTESACLDVCPTGALMRTEFGTVVVQSDICNGCGYCIPACPFGVIDRREDDGRAWKCTLCYDRLGAGQEPPGWPGRCWRAAAAPRPGWPVRRCSPRPR